LMEYIYCCY